MKTVQFNPEEDIISFSEEEEEEEEQEEAGQGEGDGLEPELSITSSDPGSDQSARVVVVVVEREGDSAGTEGSVNDSIARDGVSVKGSGEAGEAGSDGDGEGREGRPRARAFSGASAELSPERGYVDVRATVLDACPYSARTSMLGSPFCKEAILFICLCKLQFLNFHGQTFKVFTEKASPSKFMNPYPSKNFTLLKPIFHTRNICSIQ